MEVRAALPHLRPSPHVDRHLRRQPGGSSRSWRKEPRKRGYLTRRVNPMQALRLDGKPHPRPALPSNPVHPHLQLALLTLVPILEAKSIQDGECLTTELTSECMTAKEKLVSPVPREILARQLHNSILVQLNQVPAPTREVPVHLPLGAPAHLREALGSLRCLDPPRAVEAMRCRWEWEGAAVWTLGATPSRGRQATAGAATQGGFGSQMEPLSGSPAAGPHSPQAPSRVVAAISKEVLANNNRVEAFNQVASMEALTQISTLLHLRVTFNPETSIRAHTLNLEHVAVLDRDHKDPLDRLVLALLDPPPRVSRDPHHV